MRAYDHGNVTDSGYWRACLDLTALSTTITEIVTAAPLQEGPDTIGGQPSVFRAPRLVLRGFAYSFTGAAGVGFDIVFRNNQGNLLSDETQWAARTGSDGVCELAVNDIVWPLYHQFEDSPGVWVAGVLAAQRVGAITSGYLNLWGSHSVGDVFGPQAYGQSSITF